MEQTKAKAILKRIFCRHWIWIVLLTILSGAGLSWVFLTGQESSWLAYPIYVLSAYWLAVLTVALVPVFRRRIQREKEREQAEAAMGEAQREKKMRFSFLRSLVINLAFAIFKMGAGLSYHSTWLITVGIYYMALTMIRSILLVYERKLERSRHQEQKLTVSWNCYQVCGWLLLLLNLTMTGMVFQMIWQGEGSSYPELVVYAVAAYTFYRLGVTILNVFKSRKNTSPILAAARNLDLSVALMSLFTLQTAMFSAFGGTFEYQYLMNSLTGGAVCLLVVCAALGMVLHGRKIKRRINGG